MSTFTQNGPSTLNGNVTVTSGNLDVENGNVTISGNIYITGSLNIDGDTISGGQTLQDLVFASSVTGTESVITINNTNSISGDIYSLVSDGTLSGTTGGTNYNDNIIQLTQNTYGCQVSGGNPSALTGNCVLAAGSSNSMIPGLMISNNNGVMTSTLGSNTLSSVCNINNKTNNINSGTTSTSASGPSQTTSISSNNSSGGFVTTISTNIGSSITGGTSSGLITNNNNICANIGTQTSATVNISSTKVPISGAVNTNVMTNIGCTNNNGSGCTNTINIGGTSTNSSVATINIATNASADNSNLANTVNIGTTATTITLNGTLTNSSDYRLKENITPLSDLYSVDNLKPVSYNFINSESLSVGFIAHEFQESMPKLVKGKKDGETMQSIDYMSIIGILVKEVQELKKQVALLKA